MAIKPFVVWICPFCRREEKVSGTDTIRPPAGWYYLTDNWSVVNNPSKLVCDKCLDLLKSQRDK